MVSNHNSVRRLIHTFGLALAAMLAIGVITASASQAASWHIDGKEFTGEETFEASGTFEWKIQFGVTFQCKAKSKGTIHSGDKGKDTVSLYNCELVNSMTCEVQEPLGFSADLAGNDYKFYGSTLWTLTVLDAEEEECSWWEVTQWSTPALSAKMGSEAVNVPVSVSGAGKFGSEAVTYSGSWTRWLTGPNKGKTFGYW